MGGVTICMLLLFSICISPARRMDLYKDIKGSHVGIRSMYFSGISWWVTAVNQIHMESWLTAVGVNYRRITSVWPQIIAFSLQSLRLLLSCGPSSLIPRCIFKGVTYSYEMCVCVCVFLHTKQWLWHFDEVSVSVIVSEWIWMNQTSFHFNGMITIHIWTICCFDRGDSSNVTALIRWNCYYLLFFIWSYIHCTLLHESSLHLRYMLISSHDNCTYTVQM